MKIPTEDLEALQRIMLSEDWKVALRYIERLHNDSLDELLSCETNPAVVSYYRASYDGSKKLLKSIRELKNLLRSLEAE